MPLLRLARPVFDNRSVTSIPVRRFLRSRAPQRLNARLPRARGRRQASSRSHIFNSFSSFRSFSSLRRFARPNCPPIQQWAPASSSMGRRRGPQASLTHCLIKRANRQANPSVGKEYKRFRFQTFAQSEYAEFDETLDLCALGSATGGKHVSAISHSCNFPIEITRAKFVTVV